MRFPLLLLFFVLLLLAFGAWMAPKAANPDQVREALTEARRDFAKIPIEEFLRDRANVLEGTVVDHQGQVVVGAEILVYPAHALNPIGGLETLGQWPVPEPERSGKADEQGQYRFEGLDYGSKTVVFRHPGYLSNSIREISFADGYGAREVDGALGAAEELAWSFRYQNGEPCADMPVRFLPRGWAATYAEGRTDQEGRVVVPTQARLSDGEPHVVIGEPPILLPDYLRIEEQWTVPDSVSRTLSFEGTTAGSVQLSFLPEGATRAGAWATTVELADGRVELEMPPSGFGLLATQGDRRAYVHWTGGQAPPAISLAASRELEVHLQDENGEALPGIVAWQPGRLEVGSPFETDALSSIEGRSPLFRFAETEVREDAFGPARLEDLLATEGVLIAESPGRLPQRIRLAADQAKVELQLEAGLPISLRTDRPYLPVQVNVLDLPTRVGRTDAAGETAVYVPPGPVVVRAGFTRKGRSYPKGYFAGSDGTPLRFSVLDDRGRPRGCVYGFVLDAQGQPLAKWDVYLQGASKQDTSQTDEHGFFRFTGLNTGPYLVFARPKDDYRSYRKVATVELLGIEGVEEGETRVDFRAGPGVLVVRAPDTAEEPRIQLATEDNPEFWGASGKPGEMLRIGYLPEGEYLVRAYMDEEDTTGQELGTIEIKADLEQPIELNWEAQS